MHKKDYIETQRELESIYNKTRDFAESINLDGLKGELEELRKKTLKDDFWKDRERFTEVNLQISRIEKRVDYWDRLIKDITEERDLMEMALAESDEEILSEICDKIGIFKNRFDELETLELFSGEDDQKNVFLTIHPGAGGTESQDWAIMLYRMYLRWAENRNHNIDIIDYTPGEDAGIKEATIRIIGDYAYGMLKSERGIHRLVRISPFDANRRRHTSFASVEVIPEVFDDVDIEIDESELRIDTYRASGAGGQHVNTTDSAVRITHLPTGIVVQCQNERSQHKNRAFAMKILKSKIYELKKKRLDEERMERIGEKKDISWGNQIRSYIFQPYTLVKDHRTSEETGNVESVLDGEIDRFIYAYLRDQKKN